MKKRFEVCQKAFIRKRWSSIEKQNEEYLPHAYFGGSGSYNSKTKWGYIASFLVKCRELLAAGYKNMQFCNGGDDDYLVIDHQRKEFGFFEDGYPSEEELAKGNSLRQLWKEHF